MSRAQDYIEIADAIRRARERVYQAAEEASDLDYVLGISFAIHEPALEIARLFERKSSAFDMDLFLRNCGVIP